MNSATDDVCIENLINSLLSLDCVESVKDITDRHNEILTIPALYCDIAVRQCRRQQFPYLVSVHTISYLFPIIQDQFDIVIVLGHKGRKLSEVLPPKIDASKTHILELPFIVLIEEHLVL